MIATRLHRQGAAAIAAALLCALALAAPAGAAPTFVSKWGSGGTLENQFDEPRGVATDSSGNVYVVDGENHRVQKFSADGAFERMWGFNVAGGGQAEVCTSSCQAPTAGSAVLGAFSSPQGIAVSSDSVYVADRGNSRIQRFNLDGTNPREWGSVGQTGGLFNATTGVAVDGAGNVYVADEFNRRIQKFDASGGFLRAWGWDVDSQATGTQFEICTSAPNCKAGVSGTENGQFIQPADVATDSANNVYVVEWGVAGGPIQKFDSNGNFLGRWAGGASGTAEGQFNQATGVGIEPSSGNPMITDRNNRRVQRFDPFGGFLLMWGWDVDPGGGTGFEVCTSACQTGQSGVGDGQFSAPFDVTLGSGDSIYVSDSSLHRIQRFNDPGGQAPTPPVIPPPAPTPPTTELPPPVLGRAVNVSLVRGRVLIAVPTRAAGRGPVRASQKGLRFVPLTADRQVPTGSFLNTRRGTVRLQSARNSAGATQTGDFAAGLFQVLQSRRRSARGLTDLVLKGANFNSCNPRRGKRAQAALSRRALRRLRANARGRFRTRGRYSAATVRGTVWTTTDRCDGTLTKVSRGRVAVRDFRRKRTVLVRAGKSYLARAPG